MTDRFSDAEWFKASGSNDVGCVEVAFHSGQVVLVRDSKDPGGRVLLFAADAWREFTGKIKAGT